METVLLTYHRCEIVVLTYLFRVSNDSHAYPRLRESINECLPELVRV
jgi:hypothetical protein